MGAWPSHLYLFLPYLHFDTYINLIRRRTIVRERQKRGRTRPVPRPVANMSSLDVKVIWEFIDHDPPLNTRRTLDRYGYPTLTDTWARDDDQMMYKLTKAGNTNLFDVSRISSTTSNDMMEQSPLSPPSPYSARSAVAEPKQAPETGQKSQFDFDENILDGNVLMVDQLWLWAVDMKTLTTFFPKRDSHPTEGPMFQQGDLRNSVYNELNGDLTGRCENALDLAAFVTLHAVTVLLDRTSHPDLEIFRIFDEAISMLTERLTSSLKRFRMQTFRNRIHESDEDDSDHNDTRSETIRQRHEREIAQAERENKENTSALLELRDMDDELKTLNRLFEEQRTVVTKMQELYEKPELLRETEHGRKYLQEASEKIGEYEGQVADMLRRIETTRDDYEKFLNMVQRKAQVDEVRWNRLQVELSKTQNLSVIIFTAFTVIFLPLSFFTSLFGMNTSNWAGDEGSDYKSLQEIGAVSLPISLAIIVLALVAAFSSRVQDAVGSLFKVLKGGWGETRRLETERLIESRKERNYDFWDTVRRERPTTYNIPNVNKVTPTQHHLTRRSTWRSGHWKDKSLGTERKY